MVGKIDTQASILTWHPDARAIEYRMITTGENEEAVMDAVAKYGRRAALFPGIGGEEAFARKLGQIQLPGDAIRSALVGVEAEMLAQEFENIDRGEN